ncbi:hypothetical protein BDN71DRAFT_1511844 [Pleurotus eryngii]|uniref:Uncharacterized protein n=1 Tax=Pleurotus eryngii TaxID=5323 RepID=A0A9P6DBI7_PLEER|nr:hypothetical protein BDN71DRAFT_1511844 [Pleurotus eryngii]
MAPKHWTTIEGCSFLLSFIGEYKTTQAGGTAVFALFWPPFFEKWFLKFSIDDDDRQQQQAAKENSGASDNNDNGKEPGDAVNIEPTDTQTEEPTERGEKIRRKKELYSKSHYQLDSIKAKVDQCMIDEALKGKVETKAEVKHCWTKIYNKEIGQAWGAIDPTLQKEMEEKAVRLAREEKEAWVQVQAQANDSTPTAKDTTVALSLMELQQHIQLLPVLIPPLLQQLQAKTKWAFSLLAGGPLPIANGDIDVCTFDIRETVLGNSSSHVYRDFQEGVLRPYTEFVRLVFNAEARQASALNPCPNWSLAPDPTPSEASSTSAAKPSSQVTIEKNLELPVPSFPILNDPFTLPTGDNDQSLTAELFRDLPLFNPQLTAAHATTDFRALND